MILLMSSLYCVTNTSLSLYLSKFSWSMFNIFDVCVQSIQLAGNVASSIYFMNFFVSLMYEGKLYPYIVAIGPQTGT